MERNEKQPKRELNDKQLQEMAQQFAEGKLHQSMSQALADAYMEGYRAGWSASVAQTRSAQGQFGASQGQTGVSQGRPSAAQGQTGAASHKPGPKQPGSQEPGSHEPRPKQPGSQEHGPHVHGPKQPGSQEHGPHVHGPQIEYIDLGLPSGTLWAADFVRDGDEVVFLSYDRATYYHLPTVEDWDELMDLCAFKPIFDEQGKYSRTICLGPNGRTLFFDRTGFRAYDSNREEKDSSYFWLKNFGHRVDKEVVQLGDWGESVAKTVVYKGCGLPVRPIRLKKQ